VHVQAAVGTGPVDAAFKAVDAIVQQQADRQGSPARQGIPALQEFAVHAVTEGIDALGEVTVRVMDQSQEPGLTAQTEIDQPRMFGGYGADTDIVVASVKAYLAAVNKLLIANPTYENDARERASVNASQRASERAAEASSA
jgi:2-isopropylmalate synthase